LDVNSCDKLGFYILIFEGLSYVSLSVIYPLLNRNHVTPAQASRGLSTIVGLLGCVSR